MFELNPSITKLGNNTEDPQSVDLIVIGGGPAGSSAALYGARAGLDTLVIDKALSSGALGITQKIANYPGVTEVISGAELLERMRTQAESFGARYLQEQVIGLNLSGPTKKVYTGSALYQAAAVIIATGSMGRASSIPGESELLGRGVSYCATCDAPFFQDKAVAVIGSNEEAASEALHLSRFAQTVHLLTPKRALDVPQPKMDQLDAKPNIHIMNRSRVRKILGQEQVKGLRLADGSVLEVTGVFIYLPGNKPATDFLDGLIDISSEGCLIVDKQMATSVDGLFAVGDVVCDHVKQAVVAASDGAIAAMAADAYLHDREDIASDWS